MNFKKLRAQVRFLVKRTKKNSWSKYASSIKSDTPMATIWNKVLKIKGSDTFHQITTLTTNDKAIIEKEKIAEIVANYSENNSSDKYYKPFFYNINTKKKILNYH